jgi:hypothetical protein
VGGDPLGAVGLWYKRDLIKRKFDADAAEPSVTTCSCFGSQFPAQVGPL